MVSQPYIYVAVIVGVSISLYVYFYIYRSVEKHQNILKDSIDPNWVLGGPGSSIISDTTPTTYQLFNNDGTIPSIQGCLNQIQQGNILVDDSVTGIGFDGFDMCSFYKDKNIQMTYESDKTLRAMTR